MKNLEKSSKPDIFKKISNFYQSQNTQIPEGIIESMKSKK